MEKKLSKKKKSETTSATMPDKMFNQVAARLTEERLNDLLSDLHYAIEDIRAAGVTIESVEDIERTNREEVAKQLEADKAAYFRNMVYVPKSLRHQADEEFAQMARELLPLADQLQSAYKACSVQVHLLPHPLKGLCVEYDQRILNAYIETTCTVPISPKLREYYTYLHAFVESWKAMAAAAKKLGVTPPNGGLVKQLMKAEDINVEGKTLNTFNTAEEMDINPERMFSLITQGIIV